MSPHAVPSTRDVGRTSAPRLAARSRVAILVVAALLCAPPLANAQRRPPPISLFSRTASTETQAEALRELGDVWRDGYAMILWDIARFLSPAERQGIVTFLEQRSGKRYGQDLVAWHKWIWSLPYDPHPEYPQFKSAIYGQIDPRFRAFFPPGVRAEIRLDEIDWGGVHVNGIPPLEYPHTVTARDATYLADSNIVFGIEVNGEARAYPRRILAWHEMAIDRVGGTEITVVYCTLCGTVIPFDSDINGRHVTLGTSGLLYRSNKLMFDHETNSLWDTFAGTPVVGPLVGSGLRLRPRAVVTTTWREWRTRHPDTTVLSLDTGHVRDYSEGAAYRDYFSNDQLMFPVPGDDTRLPNKAEVLVLQGTALGAAAPQHLAIAARFLAGKRVYQTDFAGMPLVVVTSPAGANRVFNAGTEVFVAAVGADVVVDVSGRAWRVTEDALALIADPAAMTRPRVPAQRAFWFGWHAQFPDTRLIK